MTAQRLMFFYGTLMSGGSRGGTIAAAGLGRKVGDARIRGDLWSVGGSFPAYRRGDGVVVGEVWEPLPGREEALLRMTDSIEGYHASSPETSMYVRETVELLDDPEGRSVQVYQWNNDPARDPYLTPIPSGDWRDVSPRWARRDEPVEADDAMTEPDWFDDETEEAIA